MPFDWCECVKNGIKLIGNFLYQKRRLQNTLAYKITRAADKAKREGFRPAVGKLCVHTGAVYALCSRAYSDDVNSE